MCIQLEKDITSAEAERNDVEANQGNHNQSVNIIVYYNINNDKILKCTYRYNNNNNNSKFIGQIQHMK